MAHRTQARLRKIPPGHAPTRQVRSPSTVLAPTPDRMGNLQRVDVGQDWDAGVLQPIEQRGLRLERPARRVFQVKRGPVRQFFERKSSGGRLVQQDAVQVPREHLPLRITAKLLPRLSRHQREIPTCVEMQLRQSEDADESLAVTSQVNPPRRATDEVDGIL